MQDLSRISNSRTLLNSIKPFHGWQSLSLLSKKLAIQYGPRTTNLSTVDVSVANHLAEKWRRVSIMPPRILLKHKSVPSPPPTFPLYSLLSPWCTLPGNRSPQSGSRDMYCPGILHVTSSFLDKNSIGPRQNPILLHPQDPFVPSTSRFANHLLRLNFRNWTKSTIRI